MAADTAYAEGFGEGSRAFGKEGWGRMKQARMRNQSIAAVGTEAAVDIELVFADTGKGVGASGQRKDEMDSKKVGAAEEGEAAKPWQTALGSCTHPCDCTLGFEVAEGLGGCNGEQVGFRVRLAEKLRKGPSWVGAVGNGRHNFECAAGSECADFDDFGVDFGVDCEADGFDDAAFDGFGGVDSAVDFDADFDVDFDAAFDMPSLLKCAPCFDSLVGVPQDGEVGYADWRFLDDCDCVGRFLDDCAGKESVGFLAPTSSVVSPYALPHPTVAANLSRPLHSKHGIRDRAKGSWVVAEHWRVGVCPISPPIAVSIVPMSRIVAVEK